MTRPPLLDEETLGAWLRAHPRWHVEVGHLVRTLSTSTYPESVRLLQAQVTLAERLEHHPIVTLGYRRARFELWTHDQHGLTTLDLLYAQGLDDLVAQDFSATVE